MMYRSRALLDLARGQPCLLRVPGVCCGDDSTTVACHSNEGAHGKGKGIKAHDFMSVWGCHACHTWLDQGAAPQALKLTVFLVAHELQIAAWQEIAMNICAKPARVEAARLALQALKRFQEPQYARVKNQAF